MATNSKDPKVLLNAIAKFMAEQTEQISDEELLEEANDAGGVTEQLAPLKRSLQDRETKTRSGYPRDHVVTVANSREVTKGQDIEKSTWLSELPLRDMIKFRWLDTAYAANDQVTACLQFFNVPDIQTWRKTYRDVLEMAAFRTSPTFASTPAAVAAWLRRGEIMSSAIECRQWNPKRFEEELRNIRSLSRKKDPQLFLPELQKRCAECGVAVVVVRAPSGCRASGATRFISESKALLLLSFRYLSDDHFWFTFFHEAGHLLLHGKRALFLEGAGFASTKKEEEANTFSAEMLIPPEYKPDFLNLGINSREVIRFAMRVGISPGIVVGQLQYFRHIGLNQLNRLKRRFTWSD
jgi:hypothetical protein